MVNIYPTPPAPVRAPVEFEDLNYVYTQIRRYAAGEISFETLCAECECEGADMTPHVIKFKEMTDKVISELSGVDIVAPEAVTVEVEDAFPLTEVVKDIAARLGIEISEPLDAVELVRIEILNLIVEHPDLTKSQFMTLAGESITTELSIPWIVDNLMIEVVVSSAYQSWNSFKNIVLNLQEELGGGE